MLLECPESGFDGLLTGDNKPGLLPLGEGVGGGNVVVVVVAGLGSVGNSWILNDGPTSCE